MTEQRPDGPARGEAAIRAEIDALVRRVLRPVEDAEANPHPHHVSARRTGLGGGASCRGGPAGSFGCGAGRGAGVRPPACTGRRG